jgi:predicted glycosyltransferase
MVYSHDTYGLGNIRRMLAISEHLVASDPDVSVLLVSGSTMVHGFRLSDRMDYVKLPALRRVARERYSARSLDISIEQLIALRANIIRSAVVDFEPDLILVDKKPLGVYEELAPALEYSRKHLPRCRHALVLRDILDAPERTAAQWRDERADERIRTYYDAVYILGSENVFDARREYEFAPDICDKVRYCGYVARTPGRTAPAALRRSLDIEGRMVLVTPGGGEDGFPLIDAYIDALPLMTADGVTSVIVVGSDMAPAQKQEIERRCAGLANVRVHEFVDDMMAYMAAADLVVAMGGYNTLCEIASARRRAVIVPRARPVLEQSIRAERFAALGLVSALDPDQLSPVTLAAAVAGELARGRADEPRFESELDMDALPRLSASLAELMEAPARSRRPGRLLRFTTHVIAPAPPLTVAQAGGLR